MQYAKITKEPDGVAISIMHDENEVYRTQISATQWSERKANQDFQISALNISYTLTGHETEAVDGLLGKTV